MNTTEHDKRKRSEPEAQVFSCAPPVKTAILVDGSYFLKRYVKLFSSAKDHSPQQVADTMHRHLRYHAKGVNLYRILFYDCSPLREKAHSPVTKKCIDFSKTSQAEFRLEFHKALVCLRKVALRLGDLGTKLGWILKQSAVNSLLEKTRTWDSICDNDFTYEIKQKGVDIRIGLDIAALSYKKLVDKIVLVAGDSDFVPAAKLARKEGIDFVLDPMWNNIHPSLHEHIDGLHSVWPRPKRKSSPDSIVASPGNGAHESK